MANIDRHELHTLVDHIPRAMCRRRAGSCALWWIQSKWRPWPRRWTTNRIRRKSEPRWLRLLPMHLPTSRLNSSGANGHEARPVPPAGGQGFGTVTKSRPGPSGGSYRNGLSRPVLAT